MWNVSHNAFNSAIRCQRGWYTISIRCNLIKTNSKKEIKFQMKENVWQNYNRDDNCLRTFSPKLNQTKTIDEKNTILRLCNTFLLSKEAWLDLFSFICCWLYEKNIDKNFVFIYHFHFRMQHSRKCWFVFFISQGILQRSRT